MFGVDNTGSPLDTIAHIIQVALTPVFLLSGIATLLNVFSTRLSRVGDRVEAATKALETADDAQRTALSAQLKGSAPAIGRARCGDGPWRSWRSGDLRRRPRHVRRCAARPDSGLAPFRPLRPRRRMRPLRIVAFTVEMLLAATAIRAKAAQGRQSAVEDAGGEALEPQQGDDAQIDGGDGP